MAVAVGWAGSAEVKGEAASGVTGQAAGIFAATPLGSLASVVNARPRAMARSAMTGWRRTSAHVDMATTNATCLQHQKPDRPD